MYFLGIDFGTSGARAVVLSRAGDRNQPAQIAAQSNCQFESEGLRRDNADDWQTALMRLIKGIAPDVRAQIGRIAVNGTSATMLLCNQNGQALTEPLMYNDARARSALAEVQALAPTKSPTLSATSSLTKAIWLYRQKWSGIQPASRRDVHITHQADFLACSLHRQRPVTDYHNALKLGYDVSALDYPDWLLNSPIAAWLPEVFEPGEAIAPIHPKVAENFGIPKTCQICAGTTDSIAAFLASGASEPGQAVTSLGSTLVLKLLSRERVDDRTFGIYSHRLGNLWLVGGASNTGGAVLQKFFSTEQLAALSRQIDISQPSPYDYYPLNAPGERFPINDPDYPPRLTPRPPADSDFLHGLLEAMARIEAEGYQKLSGLGAEALKEVYTAGGGAQNQVWQALRQRRLGVDVSVAAQTEAAYGTAKLAMLGLSNFTNS